MMELKNLLTLILHAIMISIFFTTQAQNQLLPEDEVETLQTIFRKLHFKQGNIKRSFCNSSEAHKVTMETPIDIRVDISCSCIGIVCHVTNIALKGQNLSGTLPIEFTKLTQLKEIDLTRNYIDGSIPLAFTKFPLKILSLSENPISGLILKEIGDMATLEQLVLEDTKLGGPLPSNLGSLNGLRRLLLSSNNFTGTIPESFGKLKNLTDFRIDGSELRGKIPGLIGNWINITILLLSSNNFTGTIPESFGKLKNLTDFRIDGSELRGKIPGLIGNWINITILDMQGTSMEGPIPDTVSQLKKIEQLRISDLTGLTKTTKFPNLREMKNLETLVLRNCTMTGPIPNYIGQLPKLVLLDLSFNMLSGSIPGSLPNNLKHLFLNSNLLNGRLPSWVSESKLYIDISYNDFTEPSSITCSGSKLNTVSSFASTENKALKSCLKKDLPCSTTPTYYSLFINCGGDAVTYNGDEYEEDSTPGGPSFFFRSSQNWAYSSTGAFIHTHSAVYTATNTFSLNITGPDYYKTARVAPSSLRYYGLCLRKGSYKVRLYFAEIMFSNDKTFSSLGNRIFDVSIQGKPVLEKFNIAEEAKGVGKGIYREFDANVSGSTLVIHLYWSGKGSSSVPQRGVYGPLISAISMNSSDTSSFLVFNPHHSGLSVVVIIGMVACSCVFLVVVLTVLRVKGYLGGKSPEDKELRSLRLQTGYFTLRQIKTATNNFDIANKIGEGGFGSVYKGVLSDGSVIAVKQLSSKSKQGNREFVNEIGMISALQHPNLVKLYGCCIEGNQLSVIYEYMENNCLARALFGLEEQRLKLDWPTRKKICIDIAKGLTYLHEESRLKIVHRDIKATNVLLDKDLNAKISDFGLAKLDEEENTHISTRIAGTVGYMAPEYATRGYLTDKADVYSFGIVALEIVSGKSNTNYRPRQECVYLLDWAYVLQEQGNLLQLVDPDLGSNYSDKEVINLLNVGLSCTNLSPSLRPPMSSVVSMLEGETPVQAILIRASSADSDYLRFKAFEKLSEDSGTQAFSSSSGNRVPNSSSLSIEWNRFDTMFTRNEDEVRDPSPSSRLLDDLHEVNKD